jgi:hypothetical protein
MLRRHRRTQGQALVELALAITLIFFLVAAAVDVGLMYFTLQGMRTAAQEGATFGSYPVAVLNGDGSLNRVDLNYTQIVQRVRGASGATSTGFANMQDLDGNGVRDDTETGDPLHSNPQNADSWIYVQLRGGANPNNLTGTCATSVAGQGMQFGGRNCWIQVTVRYNYRLQFPLAPSFGTTFKLQVRQTMPIRSAYFTVP